MQPREKGRDPSMIVTATFSEEAVVTPEVVIHDDPKNPFPHGVAIIDFGVAIVRWGVGFVPPVPVVEREMGVGDEKI